MLVLNLACNRGHGFEGWFGSGDDFAGQQQRGLLSCPMCGSAEVQRMPSAPRLNLSGAPMPEAPSAAPAPSAPKVSTAMAPAVADLQRQVMQAVRHLVANTEDVGSGFAEEARRIHYGEAEQRGIRGRTTPDEARELADEGIDIMSLPLPEAFKDTLQ